MVHDCIVYTYVMDCTACVKEAVLYHPTKANCFNGLFFLFRHTPKGMELVPWVGGPSVLAKVEENQ